MSRARSCAWALAVWLVLVAAAAAEEVSGEEAVAAAPAEDGWIEAQPAPPPGAPLVSRVELVVPDGTETEPLAALVAVESGQPLSRRAVRRSVQRLYETGRFANVNAHAIPDGAGGVIVRFVLEPRRMIARIAFTGLTRIDEAAARRASGLREGTEFRPDRIAAAIDGIRAAYARVGYEQARVEAEERETPAGMEVILAIQEGPPTRLSGIRFVGAPGDPELIRRAIGWEAGAILDLARLEAELDELRRTYRREGYWRSRVGPPRVRQVLPGLAEVEVELHAGPRISFAFRGNRAFSSEQLRLALAWEGDEILDEVMVGELAGRIERAYRLAGWYDARVVPTEVASPDGSRLRIVFHVEEGRPLLVSEVRYEGSRGIPRAQLEALTRQAILASRGQEPLLHPLGRDELDAAQGWPHGRRDAPLDPLDVYEDETWALVAEALRTRYRDEGFLEARIDGPVVEVDEGRRLAKVTFRIEEGRRTRIARVEAPGAAALDAEGFLGRMPALRPGMPVSGPRLDEARVQLLARYAVEGFLYAGVDVEVERPEADPYQAVVRFRVAEGPRVRAGRILVQGNVRTDASVIEEALLFQEGGVVGSATLTESQQRLMRLGIFRTATIRPLDPEVPEPVKDLVVDLRERPKRSLEVGGGLSIADGPRAFAEFTERNIFGRNLEFGARTRVNYQAFRDEVREMPFEEGLERYVDLGLRYPRIYGLPIEMGWRADLITERDIRPAYALTRYSALTGVDWPARNWLTHSLALELEYNSTARSPRIDELYGELSRRDLERLRFPEGETLLVSLRPGVVFDFRDDPALPQKGLFARFEADYSRSLMRDPLHFIKAKGTVTGYVPIARRTSLALSVSGGRIFHLRDDSETILPKRFFLGGSSTLRGFSEDGVVPEDRREVLRGQIADCNALVFGAGCSDAARYLQQGQSVPSDGGEVFFLTRAELRFPIRGDLMGGVFFDAGNLWLDPANFDPTKLRPASGFGLRYATPVGPVALDLGMNLSPDRVLNEDRFALHFSIGLF